MAEEEIGNALPPEEDAFEVKRIRLEKLRDLRESGNDPFKKVKYDRNTTALNIRQDFDALENTAATWARPTSWTSRTARAGYRSTCV